MPTADTPERQAKHPGAPDGLSRTAAEAAWRAVAASIAATPHVRISRDGGRTYPARHARPLPAEPPLQPCAVPVFDPASGSGRMLALDADPARGDVDRQAHELGQLLGHLGARYVADVATSTGGRHILVFFSASLPWRELRDVARAIALRFGAVDAAPMCSLGGQVSPPGARAKRGGWRVLSTPLSEALEVVKHPNGPETWAALLTEFAAELRAVDRGHGEHVGRVDGEHVGPEAELDDDGAAWIPRLGGRANLGPELDRTARTGQWDRSRHAGRSEARMAILCAAAARGWRLADVHATVASGTWKGLAALYHRASEPRRMDRLLPAEWRRSIAFVAGPENVRTWLTSNLKSRPPADYDGADEFGLIRRWVTGTDCAVADPERAGRWGRKSVAVRQLLAAIGQAAMVSSSPVIEHGTRNLALHAGLSQRTVSRLLRFLVNEPDPLLDVVNRGRMARADRLQLRVPAAYADRVQWRRRRAGRIEGVHPAFLTLGGVAALTYQVLDPNEVRGAEVARAARLSASATSDALRVLAEVGLAERGRRGWKRGPARLDDVAESTGADALHRERAERYRQDRESWRARLRMYASARSAHVAPRDGWLGLDDEDDWTAMLASRWPVLGHDFVRGPPSAGSTAAEAG